MVIIMVIKNIGEKMNHFLKKYSFLNELNLKKRI